MVIRKYMIAVYGRLVMSGKYTLDPSEIHKKQVPSVYVDPVAEWLVTMTEGDNQ